jgi:tRNA A-37 threonylcarbamoyl transferase component Bud32
MIGTMVGNFRVIRLLGEGGMGQVFEAIQDEIEKRAAIKVLHPELSQNEEVATRFLNEAKAVNIIQHPGIVGVYEYGRLPTGAAFIIMEFLEGEPLTRRMQQRQPTSEIMRMCRQIASTLSAAHKKGIVHRDLKPDNVMIVSDPDVAGGERCKILDFGIAKVKDARAEATANQTRDGLVMGTPQYMAPEQCRGAKLVDDRADVYSLGVMLYELVSGRLPFVSDEPGTLMAMHIMQAPQPITLPPQLMQTIPPGLVALIERMMSKDSSARPAMTDVVRELEMLGAATSLPSAPPVTGEAMDAVARPGRRNLGLWAAVAATLLIVGVGATLVALRKAKTTQLGRGSAPPVIHERPEAEPGEPAPNADDAGCMVGRWCLVPSPASTTTLLAVAGSGNSAFAVGYAGTLARYQHGHWKTMPSPVPNILRGVWAASPREAWAVGDKGVILHFDGTRWTEELSATASGLNDVFGLSADDVWAVGQLGTVLRRQGGRWTALDSHTVRGLDGVWGSDAGTLWVVGQGGTVLQFNGTRFVTVVSGTTKSLNAVGGSAADDVWAVGQAGTVVHYNGFAWAAVKSPSTQSMYSVLGSGRGQAWAAGDFGAIVRLGAGAGGGGIAGSVVGSGTTEQLSSIGSDGQGLWAVGRAGTLLRYRR